MRGDQAVRPGDQDGKSEKGQGVEFRGIDKKKTDADSEKVEIPNDVRKDIIEEQYGSQENKKRNGNKSEKASAARTEELFQLVDDILQRYKAHSSTPLMTIHNFEIYAAVAAILQVTTKG